MLQNSDLQLPVQQVQYEDRSRGIDPKYYFEILKKRWLLFAIPAVLILTIGIVIVILRPVTYVSLGKILVETQQIPVELVRPTVTATAVARIQVIEQRVMTRDHLLAIQNKFGVFKDQRGWFNSTRALSGTDILDKMRLQAQIRPVDLDLQGRRPGLNTIAFSVSFEHEQPDMARRVANELVTLILAEDARTRSSRAAETTQFLASEAKRLESELGLLETKIGEFRRNNRSAVPEQLLLQMVTLRTELQQKAAIYSPSHPSLKPLQQQLAALEQTLNQSVESAAALDALQRQQTTIQRNLDDVGQKLTIARRGETLERSQQAERLEVIEQPIMPSTPVKGNRMKLLVGVLFVALAAGVGAVFIAEIFDRTVRGPADLMRMFDAHLIVTIPYISTKAEALRKRKTIIWGAQAAVAVMLAGLVVFHFLWVPLDELWDKILLRLG